MGLAEDDADETGCLAKVLQGVAVVDFELVAGLGSQFGPAIVFGDGVVVTQLGHLIGQLEKEEVGDLLHVVAITDSRVFEDVGVVPDFGDDGG